MQPSCVENDGPTTVMQMLFRQIKAAGKNMLYLSELVRKPRNL
jgi:hypothetical protein